MQQSKLLLMEQHGDALDVHGIHCLQKGMRSIYLRGMSGQGYLAKVFAHWFKLQE